MNYILDVYKYIPEFLKDSELITTTLDALNTLISDDQPVFSEIKGAYNDMMYRTRNYAQLTYDAKITIIKDLGFSYLLDIIELDNDQLTKLLLFFELIYVLKGKREGLELCLDLLLNVNSLGVYYATLIYKLILNAEYINSLINTVGDSTTQDLELSITYDRSTHKGNITGSLETRSSHILEIDDIFYHLNTTYYMNYDNYILSISEELTDNSIFSFKIIEMTDSNREIHYKVTNINVIAPSQYIEQNTKYEYTTWDEEEPKAERFTAKLKLKSIDYSPNLFSKVRNFIRSYMLPWVDISIEETIDADYLYIYISIAHNFGEHINLRTPPNQYDKNGNITPEWQQFELWINDQPSDVASIESFALYDRASDVYDRAMYGAEVFDGPNQFTPFIFDTTTLSVNLLREINDKGIIESLSDLPEEAEYGDYYHIFKSGVINTYRLWVDQWMEFTKISIPQYVDITNLANISIIAREWYCLLSNKGTIASHGDLPEEAEYGDYYHIYTPDELDVYVVWINKWFEFDPTAIMIKDEKEILLIENMTLDNPTIVELYRPVNYKITYNSNTRNVPIVCDQDKQIYLAEDLNNIYPLQSQIITFS